MQVVKFSLAAAAFVAMTASGAAFAGDKKGHKLPDKVVEKCVTQFRSCIDHVLDETKPPPTEPKFDQHDKDGDSKSKTPGKGAKMSAEKCDKDFGACVNKVTAVASLVKMLFLIPPTPEQIIIMHLAACKSRNDAMKTFCSKQENKDACVKAVDAGKFCRDLSKKHKGGDKDKGDDKGDGKGNEGHNH